MTAQDFIAKWQLSQLKERSASQEYFIDLYRLLGESTPAEVDPQCKTVDFLAIRPLTISMAVYFVSYRMLEGVQIGTITYD
jgi:hypothetical protein